MKENNFYDSLFESGEHVSWYDVPGKKEDNPDNFYFGVKNDGG